MSNIDARRQSTQQSYSDMYSAARQQAVRGRAEGGPTLSGGMGQQQRDYISAAEMQQLGQIGQQREAAARDLFTQTQSAMSNAQLEGQQATQMQLQNQQAQLQLIQQRDAILNSDLTEEQKAEQLQALGVDTGTIEEVRPGQATPGSTIGTALVGGSAVAAGIAYKAGQKQIAKATAGIINRYGQSAGTKYLATKAGQAAVQAKLGWAGKLVNAAGGKAGVKFAYGLSKSVLGKAFGFAFKKILPVWLVATTVESIAELAGVAGGRGLSGLLTKEGTWADKAFETLGL
jgi:hypothetical protein